MLPSGADAHHDNTQAARQAIKGGKARNVILLLGDGIQTVRAAGGPQAANVLGVTDQTALFFTMQRALGLG